MEKETVISKEELIELTGKLKKYANNWASLMAAEISSTNAWKAYTNDPLTVENCRKISDGTIKGVSHRRLYMKVGIKMLAKFMQEDQEDKKLIESTK